MPEGVWSWRATVLVTGVVLTLLVLVLAPDSRDVEAASTITEMVTYVAVLAGAVLVYFHWRSTASRAAAWLSTALLFTGVCGVVRAALLLTHPSWLSGGSVIAVRLVLAALVLGCAAVADQRDLRHDPAVLGLSLGGGLALVQVALSASSTPDLPDAALDLGRVALCVLAFLTAGLVLRLSSLDAWVRGRLALVVVLLNLGQVGHYLSPDVAGVHAVAIAADLAGATLLLAVTIALLRVTIGAARAEIDDLHDQLQQVEAGVRVDRERLHEIGSTIAGIASATQVMRTGSGITEQRRHLLEQMLDSEIGRLERLLLTRAPLGPRPFSIDSVIGPLVLSHQSRGHVVDWSPTGLAALGNPDDLAEVVNILLENAARHGGGDATRLSSRLGGDLVEISVSDRGPGVADAERARIFDWGVRSEDSCGEGIGLHIARSLMDKNGGSLELAPSSHQPTHSGATFVATIREAVVSRDIYSR